MIARRLVGVALTGTAVLAALAAAHAVHVPTVVDQVRPAGGGFTIGACAVLEVDVHFTDGGESNPVEIHTCRPILGV